MAVELESGDWAAAVRTASGWALKPVCPAQTDKPALAVRTGSAWAIAPYGKVEGGYYLVLREGGGKALLPLSCPDDDDDPEEPCSGTDPLCSICGCASGLAESYVVSISGFPSVCSAEVFNGVWTVTWVRDCLWQYCIDSWNTVQMWVQDGPFWQVTWGSSEIGGLAGTFAGIGESECAPESLEYEFWEVLNTSGCTGLSAGVQAASVLVTRED